MDLVYSDIQAEYRTQVQRFAENVLRPLVETEFDFSQALDSEDVARFRKRIESHEIATTAPTVENGDLDLICFGIFIEEISRVNCGLASLANALFFPVWDMVTLLDEPQLERYGHLFAPGQIISMGLSEPNVGSNPSQIETVADPDRGRLAVERAEALDLPRARRRGRDGRRPQSRGRCSVERSRSSWSTGASRSTTSGRSRCWGSTPSPPAR